MLGSDSQIVSRLIQVDASWRTWSYDLSRTPNNTRPSTRFQPNGIDWVLCTVFLTGSDLHGAI